MKALQIEPDYTATTSDIFKDMTCKYIRRFKNLELLRLCDLHSQSQGSKSFVPNFAVPKSESRLFSVYAHAGSRQSYIDTESRNIEVKGRIMAKIQNVCLFRKPIATSALSGDNHMGIIKTYSQWEPEGLMTSTTYPLGGTLLDAFIMLLSNGFCKETYHMPHLPTIQESKKSFLAVVWSRGDANLVENPEFQPYLGELKSDRSCLPADVRDGDVVSVLASASIPIVLQPVVDRLDAYQVEPCFHQGVMLGQGLLGPLPEDWLCIINDNRKWCFRKQGSEKRVWEDPRLWPLPSHWKAHFCDFDDDNGPCDGSCELEYDKADQLTDRWFFNTQSKERSKNDPRLDVQGLEAGGITLQSFTLV